MSDRSARRRHVLITGAAGGIGAGIAESFADSGDLVSTVDVREHGSGDDRCLVGDLADADFAASVLGTAWQRHGPVDVVIAAAGIYPATPFLQMSAEVWDRVHAVNVRSAMLIFRELGRHCAVGDRAAVAVALTSGAANRARQGAAHYCTSKAALEVLVRAAALELGPLGIRVNGVSPGFVDVDSGVNPVTEQYAEQVSANPLGRRGTAADIAAAVQWMVSDQAPWVTGSILRVDGGASAGAVNLPLHWTESTDIQRGGR